MKSRNKKFDAIEITSRLLNIILDMPVEQQLELLDQLDTSDYKGLRKYPSTYLKHPWVVLVNPDKEKIFMIVLSKTLVDVECLLRPIKLF